MKKIISELKEGFKKGLMLMMFSFVIFLNISLTILVPISVIYFILHFIFKLV